MTSLKDTLTAKGVRKVALIDDAFDAVPLAADLGIDESEWIQFFEDLTDEDRGILDSKFSGFQELKADQLKEDNGFVAVLWRESPNLSGIGASKVFNRYREDHALDLKYLEALEKKLADLNLECVRCGRHLEDSVHSADIVFADLFMGSLQDESAFAVSAQAVKKIVSSRKGNPPLVILMSRSHRLKERRQSFRDDAELLEACFRIIQKADILNDDVLERTVLRLVLHRDESMKLAAFLFALETGIENAGKAAVGQLRKLSPSDHTQIQHLLLKEDGESLGAYLVDVFDALVLHELERDHTIVQTAKALASWNRDELPPPYIEDSKELQYLVYQVMFHHRERTLLSEAMPAHVTFGDILKWVDESDGSLNPNRDLTQVWLVITPACDLVREAPESILLVEGKLEALQPKNWVYGDNPIRTPVIVLENDRRFRIRWDVKNLKTLNPTALGRLLAQRQGCRICGRLRYAYALEVQQKVLASLGRVGVLAPMPATFRVNLSVHLVGLEGDVFGVELAELLSHPSRIYVGRTGGLRLSICEDSCDAIMRALTNIDEAKVHVEARPLFSSIKSNPLLLRTLESGLEAPGVSDTSLKELKLIGSGEQAGYITRKLPDLIPKIPVIQKAGIILSLIPVD